MLKVTDTQAFNFRKVLYSITPTELVLGQWLYYKQGLLSLFSSLNFAD